MKDMLPTFFGEVKSRWSKLKGKKGQVSIFGILIFIFEIVVYVMFLPIILSLITTAESTQGVSSFTILLMRTTPILLLVAIFLSLFVFVGGRT